MIRLSALCCLGLAAMLQAQVQRYGRPCATGSVPNQHFDTLPQAGSTCNWRIDTNQPNSQTMLLIGSSQSNWAGNALPMDLGWLGMPGCQLLCSPDVLLPMVTDSQGMLRLPLRLPAHSIGLRVYSQILGLGRDPSGQPVHGLSDGLRIDIQGPPGEHSFVSLPDTQKYCQYANQAATFVAQTRWVIHNLGREQISFVSHVGDIVHNGAQGAGGNQTEWTRARAALDLLEGKVPYSTSLGNHDYDTVNNKSSFATYLRHFGPARYLRRSWYRGHDGRGGSHAQLLEVGRRRYLHLNIEWRADDAVLLWAQGMLQRHLDLPTIISTHEFVRAGKPAVHSETWHTGQSGGNNSGEDLYRKLVEPFPQVFFVTCGHLKGEGQLSSITPLGQVVHQTLANYQFDPNGGNGWLRIMRLRPALGRLEIRTISPVYKAGSTNGPDYSKSPLSNFSLSYDEQAHRARLGQLRVLRLRQGQDFGQGPYLQAADTQISAAYPNSGRGRDPNIFVDSNGDAPQGLLRFGALVGTGPRQIPARSRIRRAILTITTEGAYSPSATGGRLHRMLRSWSPNSTYQSLSSGVQLGSEALLQIDADTQGQVSKTGTRSFDVTTAVQSWVDGKHQNHGWLIQARGTDGWGIRSSDWGTVAERPMLSVFY